MMDAEFVPPQPNIMLSEALEEDVYRQALALSTGDFLRTSNNIYVGNISVELDRIVISEEGKRLSVEILNRPNSGFANITSFKKILLTTLAQSMMFIIWRESDFVSALSIEKSGLARKFHANGKHLTRNSIKNTICDDIIHVSSSGNDAIKRSIDRICDALEVYGLVERTSIRNNLKPISGTARLADLMCNAHSAVSDFLATQIQPQGGAKVE